MNLTILFGSETGTAEELAWCIGSYALKCGSASVSVLPMDSVDVVELPNLSPVLFVCSTTGQGDAPATMRRTWLDLRAEAAPDLKTLQFAVFGLGDSNYAKYNYIAKMLHNRLQQLGGQPLVHRGLGDDADAQGLWDGLIPWLRQLWEKLSVYDEGDGVIKCVPLQKYSVDWDCEFSRSDDCEPSTEVAPINLVVKSNKRLTPQEHFQAVHHVEFERPANIAFECGDSLGVIPRNPPDVAHQLCLRCRVDTTRIVSVAPYASAARCKRESFQHRRLNVVDLLLKYFDIAACAPRGLLLAMSCFCSDDEESARLVELASSTQEYLDYCYREKRSALEVLSDFPSCHLPFEHLISNMKLLRPRLFSISSSPTLDKTVLSITVAKVEFTTPYRRKRVGLCSGYISLLGAGDDVECFISPAINPISLENKEQSMILVGPGTGVAPIRCVVREALALEWKGSIDLFFGCRHPDMDNFYCDEWKSIAEHISLRVHVAFSRLNATKVYVQHLMVQKENACLLQQVLKSEPLVLICGNAKQMPRDVERALISVLSIGADEAKALQILKQLRLAGYLVMDTWSA